MLTNFKLKELRQHAELSLQEIAVYCGVTKQYISQVELGQKPIVNDELYKKWCNALAVLPQQKYEKIAKKLEEQKAKTVVAAVATESKEEK